MERWRGGSGKVVQGGKYPLLARKRCKRYRAIGLGRYRGGMFQSFPFFYSEDFAAAEAIHTDFQLGLSLRQRVHLTEAMTTRANVFESATLGLYGYSYSHDVTLNALSENPDFWISAHFLDGGNGSVQACRPASPGDDDPMELAGKSQMLGIRLDGARVNRFIESYIGETLDASIRFTAELGRLTAADALVSSRLWALSKAPPSDVLSLGDPGEAQHLLEHIIEALLLHRRHTYRGFVRRLPRSAAPRDIKRAVDYIHAYADTNPSLDVLARVADVPGRTLTAHFRDYVGIAPVAYVKRVRLQNVRRALLKAKDITVAEAARAQAFAHLGRFADDYRNAFHEYPRDTRLRAQRH